MKSRLGASISPLLASHIQRRRFCKAILLKPDLTTSFNAELYSNLFCLPRFESLKRYAHSYSKLYDDFSELGPPVAKNAFAPRKLLTEKPDCFLKSDPGRKPSAHWSQPAGSRSSLADIFLGTDSPNPSNISGLSVNGNHASNLKHLSSITIQKIPSVISLSQLIDAISVFGEVSSASMRAVPNGLDCCDVAFVSEESTRRAVSVGVLELDGFHLPIHLLHPSNTVTIRIKNICKETADTAIHRRCKSIGSLEGLSRETEDAVDACFLVEDDSELQTIITELKTTVIDDCQWSAHLIPLENHPVMMSKNEDDKSELGLRFGSLLGELKGQINWKKIYIEDIQNLHVMLMHLEGQPAVINQADVD